MQPTTVRWVAPSAWSTQGDAPLPLHGSGRATQDAESIDEWTLFSLPTLAPEDLRFATWVGRIQQQKPEHHDVTPITAMAELANFWSRDESGFSSSMAKGAFTITLRIQREPKDARRSLGRRLWQFLKSR
jgi:hypothetical protein